MLEIGDRRLGGQTRNVGKELPKGDGVLAVRTKLGEVAHGPLVEVDLAPLGEHHERGRGRNGFGQRRHVEDSVQSHRFLVGQKRTRPECLLDHDATSSPNRDHAARQLSLRERIVHQPFDALGQRGRCLDFCPCRRGRSGIDASRRRDRMHVSDGNKREQGADRGTQTHGPNIPSARTSTSRGFQLVRIGPVSTTSKSLPWTARSPVKRSSM